MNDRTPKKLNAKEKRLYDRVRQILWEEWDPIGINYSDVAAYEYDSYAKTTFRFLLNGCDAYKLAKALDEFSRSSMGITVKPQDKTSERVAALLLAAKEEILGSH